MLLNHHLVPKSEKECSEPLDNYTRYVVLLSGFTLVRVLFLSYLHAGVVLCISVHTMTQTNIVITILSEISSIISFLFLLSGTTYKTHGCFVKYKCKLCSLYHSEPREAGKITDWSTIPDCIHILSRLIIRSSLMTSQPR